MRDIYAGGYPKHIRGFAQNRFFPSESTAAFEALSLIAASLAHPQRAILSSFVQFATDRDAAAQFLLSEVSETEGTALQRFLETWISLLEQVSPVTGHDLDEATKQRVRRRDGAQCCVSKTAKESNTPVEPEDLTLAYIVSPSLFDSSCVLLQKPKFRDFLTAFLGEKKLRTVESLFHRCFEADDADRSDLVLSLTKQTFENFRNGRISFNSENCSSHEQNPNTYAVTVNIFFPEYTDISGGLIKFRNKADNDTSLPNDMMLSVHHQFATSFAWLEVLRYMEHMPNRSTSCNRAKIADNTLTSQSQNTWTEQLLKPVERAFRYLWLQVPVRFRAFTYEHLVSWSLRRYGCSQSDSTYRLPYGLYIRKARRNWASKHQAELKTLQLVQKYTQIPAPRGIDAVQYADSSFLLMTSVPGTNIGPSLALMTDEQVDTAVRDLKRFIAELRQIPNETGSDFQICNALGDGILDWRIGDSQRTEMRFQNEADFHKFLTYDLPIDKEAKKVVSKSHSTKHEIFFTHADLSLRNILIDENGRISGIVDWECAGWYPEYWECTKAHFAVHWTPRWVMDVLGRWFVQYDNEIEAEDMLAAMAPSW